MTKTAPNLVFSHMGLSVKNVARMERFYTEVLGFAVTDRGNAGGMELVFLSRSPEDHHQIVLATQPMQQREKSRQEPHIQRRALGDRDLL